MKKLLLILLLGPLFSIAQAPSPRFENDTLYTSGGYKIYKGQVLQLAKGTSEAGYFRFIKFHQGLGRNDTYILENSTILVSKLRNFKNSGSDNYSIRLNGVATRKDKSTMEVDIIMEFEKAIDNRDGHAELTVPEEFRKKWVEVTVANPPKQIPADDNKKQPVKEETRKQPVPDELKKLLIADEIKKLFDLYKAGALTEEEYESQKKKLLDRQ